ncbi:MAG TPA: hypothetical protein VFG38_01985, partial [Pseudomonadales bacterium]|nr:hypothetical protein [Pseudomonadales bacterium]
MSERGARTLMRLLGRGWRRWSSMLAFGASFAVLPAFADQGVAMSPALAAAANAVAATAPSSTTAAAPAPSSAAAATALEPKA